MQESKIFFTSDTHYNHANIVTGTTNWSTNQKCRSFDTMQEHNDTLVKNINSKVDENDILYHLGDWSFGGFESIRVFREQLNCKNIHLIFGNHDHHIERNKNNIQDIFKSCSYYKEITVEGIKIIMCHYAFRVWNYSHHGSWNLYGHSHGTLDEMIPEIANPTWIGDGYYIKNYKTMDVGVDTNNLFPYSFDELKKIMYRKDVLLNIDHHHELTT